MKSNIALAFVCASLLATNAAAEQVPVVEPTDESALAPAPAEGSPPSPPPAAVEPVPPPESGLDRETGNEVLPPERADGDKKAKKKKKDGGGNGSNEGGVIEGTSNVRSNYGIGEIRLGGYLFARADLQRVERTIVNSMGMPVTGDVNTLDLSVPSARFRIDYQSPWE